MVNDVARAFFEAPMTRELCVELLEEAKEGEDWAKDMVGLLLMSVYGTRGARNFQREVAMFMQRNGFSV